MSISGSHHPVAAATELAANIEPVRLALVGCGDFGAFISAIIQGLPAFQLVAVCDPNERAATALARELGVPAFTEIGALLAGSDTEAVYITSPNHTHLPITLACAAAGRHIFCEKAMALNVAECDAMIAAAEHYGVKLTVGHKRRLRPMYARIGEIIHSGALGAPVAVSITGFHQWDWQGWWTRGAQVGGLFHAAGVHDIDNLGFFLGEATSVYALAGPKFDASTDYDDVLSMLVRFASGAIGTLQVSCRYPLRTFRGAFEYQILCERGGLLYDPQAQTLHIGGDGEEREEHFADLGFEHAFGRELDSFAAWIRRGTPPLVTADGGRRCVEIMEAAYLSARRGVPVSLPLRREAK